MGKLRGHVWIMQGMSCIQNQSFYEEERYFFLANVKEKELIFNDPDGNDLGFCYYLNLGKLDFDQGDED